MPGDRVSASGKTDPARILYLIVTLPVGGAEEHLLSLIRNLDRSRYDPLVCCIGKSGPIGGEIEKTGVRLVELGMLSRGGFDRRIVRMIREVLRREKISLLHSHLYHANFYGRLAAFQEHIPAVCTIHNTYARPKLHRRFLNRWLARRSSRIIAVSGPVHDDIVRYDGVAPSKITVIPNGVDMSRFDISLSREQSRERLGVPLEGFLVGAIGRLEEQKGLSYLIEAIRILVEGGKNVSLFVVGSGREEGRLREQAANSGIADSVFFLGTRRDVPELYRAMDVFALSSLWEGGPITLLEAMASGVPVVATPVGFVPEVLQDGKNGFIVPIRDPEELAEALWKVHEDPFTAEAAAQAGRETVRDRYSHQFLAERVMAVYEETLTGGLSIVTA